VALSRGSSSPPASEAPATGWGPPWLRRALVAAALLYLALILARAVGIRGIERAVPPSVRFFTQAACLFPQAALLSTEYRVEGWSCRQGRFVELDHRAYFPLRSDDKESRFQRLGFFYRRNRVVMEALDNFLVERQSRAAPGTPAGDLGTIGGIRFSSLRVPFPPPGAKVERYQFRPLSEIPQRQRYPWYQTGPERRRDRCKEVTDGSRP
jgi:hypothetical protein